MKQATKIFGTDGVRGVANVEPVTAETALKLGRANRALLRRALTHHRAVRAILTFTATEARAPSESTHATVEVRLLA